MSNFIPSRPGGTVWVGGDDPADTLEATPAEEFTPQPQIPGRRGFGGTVELSQGGAIATFTDHAVAGKPGVYVPNTPPAPPPATSEPPVFMRAGSDSRILARDAGMSDLVDLGGLIGVTTLQSALHNGWLAEKDGGYVKAGEAAPKAAPRKASTPKAADTTDTDETALETDTAAEIDTKTPEQSAAPAREYLDHADESMLRDIERHVSPELYSAAESFLANGEMPPEHIMARIAAHYGGDQTAAKQVIAQAVQPFYQQAASVVEQAVGPGMAEAVFEFGRSTPKGQEMLREAMKLQANERSTAGYTQLSRAYLAHLAVKDPQAVVDGINRSGTAKARLVGKDVVVDLGKRNGGEASFVSLLKSGLIR
jgi:hypothetical protein